MTVKSLFVWQQSSYWLFGDGQVTGCFTHIMSGDEKNVRFAQLNESNYTEWIICMEVQLIRLGLWDTVVFEPDSRLVVK